MTNSLQDGRCFFCHGNIIDGRCIMCGRTINLKYELFIMEEQKKEHHNYHTYSGTTERLSKKGKGNPDGYNKTHTVRKEKGK